MPLNTEISTRENTVQAKKVFLCLDDHDFHKTGCNCGLCNSNGKSYGVGIYPFTCPCDSHDKDCDHSDMQDHLPECLERVYGCSEGTALENAKAICRENADMVVTSETNER